MRRLTAYEESLYLDPVTKYPLDYGGEAMSDERKWIHLLQGILWGASPYGGPGGVCSYCRAPEPKHTDTCPWDVAFAALEAEDDDG